MFLQCFFCCICDDDQDINKKKTKKEKKREPKLLDKQQNKSHVSVRKIEEKKQNIAAKEYVEIQIKPKIQQNLLQVKQNKDVKHDIQEPAIPPFIKHQENIGQSMQNKIKRQRSSGKIIKQSSLVYGNSEKIFRIGALQSSKKQVQKKIAVNKRIDNSWRQQQSDNQQSTTFDQRIRKQGLPNMGNTCYLNSIIQFLFAAQKLISIIQKISQNKPNSFHYRLTQIFRSIGQHHKLSMKQQYLLAIIQDLIGYQPQFKPFQQNDSLQCLLTILNMLQNEDASSSKLNYFKLKYSFTCECKDNQNLMHESLHIQSRQKCSTCKKYFGIIIYSSPIYLIVIPDRELQEYMSFSKMNGEKIIYQCKAFVSYFGNRSKGHYIAHRKINDKSWICLNDSKVSPIENVKDINYIPRYCLYQFKKRISNKPLQKI